MILFPMLILLASCSSSGNSFNSYTTLTFPKTEPTSPGNIPLLHNWHLIKESKYAPEPFNPIMSDDPLNHGVLLLENGIEPNKLNETWIFSDNKWTQMHPTNWPKSIAIRMMTYDPVLKEVILLELVNTGSAHDPTQSWKTWAWNGNNWIDLHLRIKIPETAGSLGSLSFDPTTNTLKYFTINNSTGIIWELYNNSWIQLPINLRDNVAKSYMICGSFLGGCQIIENTTNHTQIFAPVNGKWMKIGNNPNPGSYIVNFGNHFLLTFNGKLIVNKSNPNAAGPGLTYEYSIASGWKQVNELPAPLLSKFSGYCYDSTDHEIVEYGGYGQWSLDNYTQTWVFR